MLPSYKPLSYKKACMPGKLLVALQGKLKIFKKTLQDDKNFRQSMPRKVVGIVSKNLQFTIALTEAIRILLLFIISFLISLSLIMIRLRPGFLLCFS